MALTTLDRESRTEVRRKPRRIRLKPLAEQVIVLTGATSGIGLATARLAAQRGARLVLVARNAESLETLAQELGSERTATVVADVGLEGESDRIRDVAESRFGPVDTWINDAAVAIYGSVLEVPVEDQRKLFETNFWGVVYGSRSAARLMRDRGGAIITIGSVLSDRTVPLQGIYCASKHAVKAWTDALRMEVTHAGDPISVTLIKPGAVDTPYPEHARNFMDKRARNPSPAYEPRVVAEAILHAACHPIREIVVGGGGMMIAALGKLFPGLMDVVMERTMWRQQKRAELADPRHADNLYGPQADGRERGTHPGLVRQSSYYTSAQLHPWTTTLMAVAGGAALAGALGAASWLRRSRAKGVRRHAASRGWSPPWR
jgi:short-subunit dehydrogenase